MSDYIKRKLKTIYAFMNCFAYGGSIFVRNVLIVLIPTSVMLKCATKMQLLVLGFYLLITIVACKIMSISTKDSLLDSMLMKSEKENRDESYEEKAQKETNVIDKHVNFVKNTSKYLLGAAMGIPTTLTGAWLKDYAENNTLTDFITMVQSMVGNNITNIIVLSIYGVDFIITVFQIINQINVKYKAAKLEANDIVKEQEATKKEQIAEKEKELTTLTAIGQHILAK